LNPKFANTSSKSPFESNPNSRTRLPSWVCDGEAAVAAFVCDPAPVTRLPGSVPSPCFAGSHLSWPLPFAPPKLLWQGLTSRDRASSATAPRLPDAERRRLPNGRSRDLPGSCARSNCTDSFAAQWLACALPYQRFAVALAGDCA
jgi:hypothetical protein